MSSYDTICVVLCIFHCSYVFLWPVSLCTLFGLYLGLVYLFPHVHNDEITRVGLQETLWASFFFKSSRRRLLSNYFLVQLEHEYFRVFSGFLVFLLFLYFFILSVFFYFFFCSSLPFLFFFLDSVFFFSRNILKWLVTYQLCTAKNRGK